MADDKRARALVTRTPDGRQDRSSHRDRSRCGNRCTRAAAGRTSKTSRAATLGREDETSVSRPARSEAAARGRSCRHARQAVCARRARPWRPPGASDGVAGHGLRGRRRRGRRTSEVPGRPCTAARAPAADPAPARGGGDRRGEGGGPRGEEAAAALARSAAAFPGPSHGGPARARAEPRPTSRPSSKAARRGGGAEGRSPASLPRRVRTAADDLPTMPPSAARRAGRSSPAAPPWDPAKRGSPRRVRRAARPDEAEPRAAGRGSGCGSPS